MVLCCSVLNRVDQKQLTVKFYLFRSFYSFFIQCVCPELGTFWWDILNLEINNKRRTSICCDNNCFDSFLNKKRGFLLKHFFENFQITKFRILKSWLLFHYMNLSVCVCLGVCMKERKANLNNCSCSPQFLVRAT